MNYRFYKTFLIAVAVGFLLFLGYKLVIPAGATAVKVDVCHYGDDNYETINIAEAGVPAHVPGHDKDYLGKCREVTPSVSITPTPEIDSTPTPTAGASATLKRESSQAGAPQIECTSPIYAPTLTFNGTEFVWTTVKDGVDTYRMDYGMTKDNLAYSTVVTGERFLPEVEWTGHIWARVAGLSEGCLGPYSLTVDP